MAIPTAHYADSDADDEYERSVLASPHLPTDDDTSPTDSDPPSTEPTPTFGHIDGDKLSPVNSILKWTAGQCADYVSSLGLPQYCEKFLENEIVGEALIALRHEELKEMAIMSVGHRLTILKGVYDIKVKQEIAIDSDHYIPPSADASVHDQTATQEDISRIIKSIEIRDRRIQHAESELRKITEEYRKLRDDLLPVFRMAKDQSQPLPYHPPSASPSLHNNHEDVVSPMVSQVPPEKTSGGLSRKFSTKRLFLGSTPKNNSPTHMPQSIPEGKPMADASNLDPSAAAVAASSHLTASLNGGSQPATSPNQPNIPSPTSPNTYPNQQPKLNPRTFGGGVQTPSTARPYYSEEQLPHASYPSSAASTLVDRDPRNPTPTPATTARIRQPTRDALEEPPTSGNREPPSVEIFKSFRVSMEDPCHRVLPAALKKYNINADWRQYALYIVYGDQERCLGLEEKPLILFKQLDREGRKPMFMLRRHAAPMEGHSGPSANSAALAAAQLEPATGLVSGRGHSSSSIQLPGGVL